MPGESRLTRSFNFGLMRSPLFAGLETEEIDEVATRAVPRTFEAGERACTAGEPADRIWVIIAGLVQWAAPVSEGGGEIELRMRKGDVIGAQDALAGEPWTATVTASLPTTTLELGRDDLLELVERYPRILLNLIVMQRARLMRAGARQSDEQRGEEIALAVSDSVKGLAGPLVAAARISTPREVKILDPNLSFAGTLTAAEQLVSSATVLIPVDPEPDKLGFLLDEVDRVVVAVGSGAEAEALTKLFEGAENGRLDVVLVGDEAAEVAGAWSAGPASQVVRSCARAEGDTVVSNEDLAWLARHLTGTKLGLALGAGGAKGYAHVGAIGVLEESGYTVDYVGGSSIGGFVATLLALGNSAAGVDETFRATFSPGNVDELFGGSPLVGGAKKAEVLTRMLKEATEERGFTDAVIPLVVMAADLTGRTPMPFREGPLWEALLTALSVAGVFPPTGRDGHELIDAIALVPVPTNAVFADGADIVISVNLLGTESLESWPAGHEPDGTEAKPKKRGTLDIMLDAMDLSQFDTSMRNAALADVVVTPKFAPTDWRAFHLADLFLGAGREAALEALPGLRELASPIDVAAARAAPAAVAPS